MKRMSRRLVAPEPLLAPLGELSDLRNSAAVLARLRKIDWSFENDDTGYLGHDLHPYPAKFIPQIPANLIASLSLRGEVVWDPFGGSGTCALEALFSGRRAISSDINPLATLITKTKCTALSPEQHEALSRLHTRLGLAAADCDLASLIKRAAGRTKRHIPDAPNLAKWFEPLVTSEIAFVLSEIDALEDGDCKDFARVALSSIIVNVSNQDGETRYATRAKGHRCGKVINTFCRALSDGLLKHEPMERLLGYRRVKALTADVRHLANGESCPADNSVDLIVTSPPYANATDYHLYHRFRLFWMGFDPRSMAQSEIGSHLRHQREKRGFDLYLEEMSRSLLGMRSRLRPGRFAVLVVGDSVFNGSVVRTASELIAAAEQLEFEVVGVIPRVVHATRRSFIAAARRTRSEDIVVLRRPPQTNRIYFRQPPYKLWGFESTLRAQEIKSVLGTKPKCHKDGSLSLELDPFQVDRGQRLAFTHMFGTSDSVGSWRTWQSVLENGDAVSARKDPKYVTHGIHPYKGKFYPQLAKSLLNLANVKQGETVLDPFCGSGTVLLEAQLNGMTAIGIDLNPLAVLISRAKCAVATESLVALDRIVKQFHDDIVTDKSRKESLDRFDDDVRVDIESWFPIPVARKLGWLIEQVDRIPSASGGLIIRVLLSSLLRDVSHQDPADLRIRRRKHPLTDAPIIELLRARIEHFRKRMRHFGERMSASPVAFPPVSVIEGDARLLSTFESVRQEVSCVVTSPPYATALPYIDTDRLSLLVALGINRSRRTALERGLTGSREIRESERRTTERNIDCDASNLASVTAIKMVRTIRDLNQRGAAGFRRRNLAALLYRYFVDMQSVFGNLDRSSKAGAHLFFVIGDNRTVAGGKDVRIESTQVLAELGDSVGWRLTDRIPISVTKESRLNSHHSITENTVLWFTKP